MHVTREDDRIDGFELVGHIRPYRIEREEGQQREHHNRHAYDHPPYNAAPRHHRRHDDRSHQCQQQRCALLSFYSHHNLQLLCFQTFFPFHPAHPAAGKRFLLFLRFSLLRSVFTSPLTLTLFLVLRSYSLPLRSYFRPFFSPTRTVRSMPIRPALFTSCVRHRSLRLR